MLVLWHHFFFGWMARGRPSDNDIIERQHRVAQDKENQRVTQIAKFQEALALIKAGSPVAHAAGRVGMSTSTLRDWIKCYETTGNYPNSGNCIFSKDEEGLRSGDCANVLPMLL